jgi:hypothetical protein
MAIKIIYTILIAILTALFVGLGIDAFYPAPVYPQQQPVIKQFDDYKNDEYTAKINTYEETRKSYERNVSIIIIICAVAVALISISLEHKIEVVGEGLLLGSVLIVLYGVVRGFAADNQMTRFIVSAVGLGLTLVIGYWKFVKPNQMVQTVPHVIAEAPVMPIVSEKKKISKSKTKAVVKGKKKSK